MANMLASMVSNLSLSGRCRRPSCSAAPNSGFSSTLRGQALQIRVNTQRASATSRSPLFVEAKQNAKQRQRLSEKQRVYNKSRKSAVATRMKKVLKALSEMNGKVESEDALKPVEKLISEAYQEIDKAIVKGVIHQNTGARRKSRLAVAKKRVLISSGLYTPAV